MHGIISVLAPAPSKLIETIWHQLETECGLTGVRATPYPHFSWQIGLEYPEPQTREMLQTIAGEWKPFTIHAHGLGVFSGPSVVVYIPIIRSAALNRLHKKLWQAFSKSAKELSPFYSPAQWVPHITLIFKDENRQSVICGLEKLAFSSFDLEIEVNNLSFVSQFENQIATVDYQYEFISSHKLLAGA